MKRRATDIQEKISKALLLAVLAGTIASCDSILNYEEDCAVEYRVKFKYDYNMEERDKFPELVRTVTLYAFDANNNLVYQKTDEGEMLADGSYVMDVDSIDPTQHHLVVWAGLNDESFAVPQRVEALFYNVLPSFVFRTAAGCGHLLAYCSYRQSFNLVSGGLQQRHGERFVIQSGPYH